MPRFDSSRLGAAKIAIAAATPAADATTNAGAADDFVAFTLTPPAGAFWPGLRAAAAAPC